MFQLHCSSQNHTIKTEHKLFTFGKYSISDTRCANAHTHRIHLEDACNGKTCMNIYNLLCKLNRLCKRKTFYGNCKINVLF